jgi:pyruvate kinase
MHSRTKIICTLGPSVNTLEKIKELITAGMNVARINFSHGTHEEHERVINYVKEARQQLGVPVAIMLDTKGPEIRLGPIDGSELFLPSDHEWQLVPEEVIGNSTQVTVRPAEVLKHLVVGTTVLFDDGYISAKVTDTSRRGVIVRIEHGGVIRSGKGINVPNVELGLPALTEKDVADIKFGCKLDIDYLAASFIRSADHVMSIKELLNAEGKSDILVIAKIENSEGVANFDQILQVADGIMIARGDLGVELPLSQVPQLQKMMIRKCCAAGKPSVTATQMLESMMYHSRPTRAETSDVANAIYDSTDVVMLSGETAVGHYPNSVVKVMRTIATETENDFNYEEFFRMYSSKTYHDVPSAVTLATVKTAYSTSAKAIFAFTSSGTTARNLSRFRPKMPIIAMTSCEKSYHQLAFTWGVIPFLTEPCTNIEQAFEKISRYALDNKYVDFGDLVVLTAGTPFGIAGTTNMMIVENIGDVLVRGVQGVGKSCHGNVALLLSVDGKPAYEARGCILVINHCDASYRPYIAEALGVILDNPTDDKESEQALLALAKELKKPAVVHAEGATRYLRVGMLVTLDPEKAIVYKGVVLS